MDTSFLLIHSSVEGHLGSFHFLGVVGNAATNMVVQRRLYIFPEMLLLLVLGPHFD